MKGYIERLERRRQGQRKLHIESSDSKLDKTAREVFKKIEHSIAAMQKSVWNSSGSACFQSRLIIRKTTYN